MGDAQDERGSGEGHAGGLFVAGLWLTLLVAVFPGPAWPLIFAPAGLGLAMFCRRAWRASRSARDPETTKRVREAFVFAAVSGAPLLFLLLFGSDGLFVLPVMAGWLLVAGGRMQTLWGEFGAVVPRTQVDELDALVRGLYAADPGCALDAAETSPRLRSLCRESLRFALVEARSALRAALMGRTRTEQDVRAELGARFGEHTADLVLRVALRDRTVRQYGAHLALAMDGAYRGASAKSARSTPW